MSDDLKMETRIITFDLSLPKVVWDSLDFAEKNSKLDCSTDMTDWFCHLIVKQITKIFKVAIAIKQEMGDRPCRPS